MERDSCDAPTTNQAAAGPAATDREDRDIPAADAFARLRIRSPEGLSATKDILRPTTLIGSAAGLCNIQLVGPNIPPAHCVLVLEREGLRVHDLRSAAGTWLNGHRVEAAPLEHGDSLQIGEFVCHVETNLPAQHDATEIADATARLVITGADGRSATKNVLRPATLIGCMTGCNVQLLGPGVFPLHALLTVVDERLRIRDLRTRPGTYVNGRPVVVWTLGDGDVIEIGTFRARVETNLRRPAETPSDRLDRRFDNVAGAGQSKPSSTVESPLLESAEQLAQREEECRQVEVRLKSLGEQLAAREEQLLRERAAFECGQENLNRDRNLLERDAADLAAARIRLEGEFSAPDERTRQLEADRITLLNERQQLESDRKSLLADRESLVAEKQSQEIEYERLREREAALNVEIANLQSQQAETVRSATSLEESRVQFVRVEESLQQTTRELARRAEVIAVAEQECQTLRDSLEAGNRDLLFRQEAAARSAEQINRTLTELEHQRHALKIEQTELAQQAAQLEREREELASARTDLQTLAETAAENQAQAEAAAVRLQSELESARLLQDDLAQQRQEVDLDARNVDERRASLNRERETLERRCELLNRDRTALERDRAALERDRTLLDQDCAAADQARREIEADFELQESRERDWVAAEAEFSTRQIELAAAQESLERENAELEERTDQLQGEQAFLRAARGQFHVTLDEFRSEQRRFSMAISSLRTERDRLRRRKESVEQIAEDRAAAQFLKAEGLLDDAQAEWLGFAGFRNAAIGEYRLGELLALGDSAWVYEANDVATKEKVAIKALNVSSAADPAERGRFKREVCMLGAIDHPNIVRVRSSSLVESPVPFFVMELVDGVTLSDLIALHGSLPWREACNYVYQASVGLSRLHDSGIIHRNVQPSNLLLEQTGGIKLIDLGHAAILRDDGSSATSAEEICDCLANDYSAPELLEEPRLVSEHADIYSLGCVFYHALTGTAPFVELDPRERVGNRRAEGPQPIRSFVSRVPSDVIVLVKRMMANDPQDRWGSMHDVASALAPLARRQYAYFDRQAVLQQRADEARTRLRAQARQIAERRQRGETDPKPQALREPISATGTSSPVVPSIAK